ncbi:pseudouridine synthase [Nocardiopsis changdeensis]|uniref:pseudouridine synthase n=1 Tax=Nocardiopsis changdeensis TaxID=2831969 RepID=UPI003F476007
MSDSRDGGDRRSYGDRDSRGGRDSGGYGGGRSYGGSREGGDRGGYRGGRDGGDSRGQGGFRGGRDGGDRGRGGYGGSRDDRGGRSYGGSREGGFRGGRDGDDRRSFGDRDSRGPGGRSFGGSREGGDRGGYRGGRDGDDRRSFGDRDSRGPGGRSFGGSREGGFRGGRDGGDRGRGGYGGSRDDRGGRSYGGSREGGDRGGYRGGRDGDDRRSFSGSREGGDRGGYRGGRDGGDSRGQGGFRGGRDGGDRGRGGYGGSRDDRGGRSYGGSREGGDRGGYRGGRDGDDRRSFGGSREGGFRGGRDGDDRRSFGDRDSRGPGGRSFEGDRDARPKKPRHKVDHSGDLPGGRKVRMGDIKSENQLSKAARERLNALRSEYDPKDEDRPDEARDSYTDVEGGIRLQKALAAAGVASRRASEEMIAAGRVSVDGEVVRRFGARVDPEKSEIRVDGMRVVTSPDKLYFALNKPRGVVSTMWDPEGRPTLADYTGQTEERIFHVGRLDTETEGLILLTNDGELSNRLTHPRYKVIKTYIAKVPGPVPHSVVKQLRAGVELEDGPVEIDSFRVVDNDGAKALVEIRLHEGRKHIVRRVMEAVGHPVADLARTQVGPIDLNTLKLGTMRALTPREVSELYKAAGL